MSRSSQFVKVVVLLVLAGVATLLTVRGARKVGRGRAATAVCEAVGARDWARAIALGAAQLVPFPVSLLRFVAPKNAELWQDLP